MFIKVVSLIILSLKTVIIARKYGLSIYETLIYKN